MSGAFHQRSWGSRFETLGDPAEEVYDAVLPLGKSDRFGLRRPDIDIRRLDPFIRFTPDRVAQSGPLVEVVGLGRDDVLKFKTQKLEALAAWNRLVTLYIFVWHSKREEWALAPFAAFRSLTQRVIKRDGLRSFDDGNEYVGIPYKELMLVKGIVRGEYQP